MKSVKFQTAASHFGVNMKSRGFTLMELMITVAIVGILAAVAYPAYTDSILKGRRAEGRAALLDLMQQQERSLTQTGTYTIIDPTSVSNLSFKNYSGDNRTSSAYSLGARACTTTATSTVPSASLDTRDCIELYATPRKSDPKVNVLSITSTGIKTCNGTGPSERCWQ